jgi:regulator of sirC expression with transglutaminase-like and TPR domain
MEIDALSFADEVRTAGEALSPTRANLLAAREIAYADLRPSAVLAELDALATQAASAIAAHSTLSGRGQALAEYLFQTHGLHGNREEYGDPRNSYIHEVLRRRLGLPISLSAVFLHIGARLGLPVSGVGMPGHFIVCVPAEGSSLYLDPFNGGQPLTREACAELVQQATGYHGGFDQRWLNPTRPHDIVARMLGNLRNTYTQMEDWPVLLRVVERLCELQPEEPAHVRDLGTVLYRVGALRRAADRLGEYLARAPRAADVDQVRQSRDMLLDELSRLN